MVGVVVVSGSIYFVIARCNYYSRLIVIVTYSRTGWLDLHERLYCSHALNSTAVYCLEARPKVAGAIGKLTEGGSNIWLGRVAIIQARRDKCLVYHGTW